MEFVTRKTLLHAMAKHETLTIDDIGKEENIGFPVDHHQLKHVLRQLQIRGQVLILSGVSPTTYTITALGIEENSRLQHT